MTDSKRVKDGEWHGSKGKEEEYDEQNELLQQMFTDFSLVYIYICQSLSRFEREYIIS